MMLDQSFFTKLKKIYPEMYSQIFYLEHDKGWCPLIEELSEKLQTFADQGYQVVATQVKEKYAGLRFYYEIQNQPNEDILEKINLLIQEYEDKSFTICEICGEEGSLRMFGWLQTQCDKHNLEVE